MTEAPENVTTASASTDMACTPTKVADVSLVLMTLISPDYTISVRWQHFLAIRTDNIKKLAKSPEDLLGEVTQPSKCRLSETGH